MTGAQSISNLEQDAHRARAIADELNSLKVKAAVERPSGERARIIAADT
jgi:hypothetical protein